MQVTSVHDDPVQDDHDADLSANVIQQLSPVYEIVCEAGRGGMATVWLALRRRDGARVALKILRSGVGRALGTRRFLREIRIATQVHAPSLMPLEDSGEVDGMLYYVMPFAEGGTLRRRLDATRQLPIEDAVRITRQLASGAGALHAEGFIHRDIKPENVLLDADGNARLADYGIARALFAAATDVHTSTGMVLGTPTYMSPEQAGGEPLDGRSDLYAIGCVLYEMLAGTPPFQGASTMAVIARHMNEEPPPLRVVRPAISSALESIVTRLLEKSPADRFPDAMSLVVALDLASENPQPAKAASRARRRNLRWAYLATSVATFTAGGAYWLSRGPEMDSSRVVVLPFTASDRSRSAEGDNLTMLIGSALERTETSQWLDGMSLMTAAERVDAHTVSSDRALELARKAKARFIVHGMFLKHHDSVRVTMRLVDAKDGTVLRRATASTADVANTSDVALRAVVQLLPALTGLSQIVDVSGLTGHDAAAVDSWLRGERAFRSTQMDSALHLLDRAVTQDSTLAPAAFRAALAASWMNQADTALSFVRLALRHSDALASRQRPFAAALERFLSGRADEAIVALRPALAPALETADAWMLAGEIQFHLLPTIGIDPLARDAIPPPLEWPYESFAEGAFLRARMIDSGYTPPLSHLAEIAARRGDVVSMTQYAGLEMRMNRDSSFRNQVRLTASCLRRGEADVDWAREVRRDARAVFRVGAVLQSATAVLPRQCAIAVFSAIVATEPTSGAEYWSSLLGLHSMLIAQGDVPRALAVIDTAVAQGLTQATGIFVIDAAAGIDVGDRTRTFLRQLGTSIETRSPPSLWLLVLDATRNSNVQRLQDVQRLLDRRVRIKTAARLDSLMFLVAKAYCAVAEHDTTRALRNFEALVPSATHREMETSLWESLAAERLLFARLLLAHGRFADALRVASTFDQPNVAIHQLFLPASLEVRVAAARALANRRQETKSLTRLALLQRMTRP